MSDSTDSTPAARAELWSLSERVGRHHERIRDLEEERQEMKDDLKRLMSLAQQVRGGLLVLLFLWGVTQFLIPLLLHR